ncbi:hypothetical protein AN958_06265 [Leucoagaricus sp. SymC.cos]|nr:hypothetical protein AN958_06265 [Leucoagaricus sp. SymC.cos]
MSARRHPFFCNSTDGVESWESQIHNNNPPHTSHVLLNPQVISDITMGENESDNSDFVPDPDTNDEDLENEFPDLSCIFGSVDIFQIQHCIANTTVPSWIERPPPNLGEKAHEKLKADQWLTLFMIFLQLILPKIWTSSPTSQNNGLLKNFHDLITCTHIVVSYSTSPKMISTFSHCYLTYRRSSQQLFPNIISCPNHHYVMHIPDLLCFWRPLI